MKSVQKLSFWSAKSLNDIFKGDGPLLESDESEGGGEARGAGRDDNDGGDVNGCFDAILMTILRLFPFIFLDTTN